MKRVLFQFHRRAPIQPGVLAPQQRHAMPAALRAGARLASSSSGLPRQPEDVKPQPAILEPIPNSDEESTFAAGRSKNTIVIDHDRIANVKLAGVPYPQMPNEASEGTSDSAVGFANSAGVAMNTAGRGLAEFFDTKDGWMWKYDVKTAGRAWTCSELRMKSFEDLHGLWWVCIKEQNLLVSQKDEARRFKVIFPHAFRLKQLRRTMANIKMVVWERRTAYLQAQEVAKRASVKFQFLEEEKEAERQRIIEARNKKSAGIDEDKPIYSSRNASKRGLNVAVTPEMMQRVEAKMNAKFKIPIHFIGRSSRSIKRRLDQSSIRTTEDHQKVKAMGRRGRTSKKGRWAVV